jgi:hypothetical protein
MMSVNFYQTTQRNNPEDSHLRTRRRENLISHNLSQDSRYPGRELNPGLPEYEAGNHSPRRSVITEWLSQCEWVSGTVTECHYTSRQGNGSRIEVDSHST